MGRNSLIADAKDVAGMITRLPAEELASFIQAQIRERRLHQVVANLNHDALSKTSPNSKAARKALSLLGFAD